MSQNVFASMNIACDPIRRNIPNTSGIRRDQYFSARKAKGGVAVATVRSPKVVSIYAPKRRPSDCKGMSDVKARQQIHLRKPRAAIQPMQRDYDNRVFLVGKG